MFLCSKCLKEADYKDTFLSVKKKGWKYLGQRKDMVPAGRKDIWICEACNEVHSN